MPNNARQITSSSAEHQHAAAGGQYLAANSQADVVRPSPSVLAACSLATLALSLPIRAIGETQALPTPTTSESEPNRPDQELGPQSPREPAETPATAAAAARAAVAANNPTAETAHSPTTTEAKPKKLYIKLEPRLYNTELHTDSYATVLRLGRVIKTPYTTTILEIGPQLLNYRSEPVFSIDGVIESYWAINNKVEVYGRWYPSYVEGYGNKSLYNTLAAGTVLRLNGGVVDVNQYSGLAALSKGQYLKAEQEVSTYNGFLWTGSRSSMRLGWAARGKRWSLALEAGISYIEDIYNGARYQPSGVFELNVELGKDLSMIMSYYPYLSGNSDLANRGELGIALIRRF
ncbi:MAG: hypothetical protein RLZZ459_1544 [Cyanobacteriota bacterium]